MSGEIAVNDLVQLLPREPPHADRTDWWWRVVRVTEYGLDVVHEVRLETRTNALKADAVRLGVAPTSVRARRSP